MRNIATSTIIALLSATIAVSACSKEGDKTTEVSKSKSPQEKKPNPPGPAVKAASTDHFAMGIMNSYEACRAILAADSSEGIVNCANGIVEASKSAHASAPDAAHEHIGALVEAAKALAVTPLDDIAKVRVAFGVVSQSVVAMLTVAPGVGKDYHVFECPMAKGYKRWAQPGATLENPYMGLKMLSCGSEVHDHHKGMMHDEGAENATGSGGHAHNH